MPKGAPTEANAVPEWSAVTDLGARIERIREFSIFIATSKFGPRLPCRIELRRLEMPAGH